MDWKTILVLSAIPALAQDPKPDDWKFVETPKIVTKGRELWVATTGKDGAPGAKENPIRTLTEALRRAGPGDTIQVKKGKYAGEREKLNFAVSGKPDAWIVLRAADGEVEVDGAGKAFEVVLISNRSYVAIEGISFHGAQDNVFHIGTDASYVVVRGCKVYGAGGGGDAIKVNGSDHIYIENCDCSDAGDELIDFMACGYCVSRGNFMHDQKKGQTATFAKGGCHFIMFEKNVVHGIRGAHAIMLGGDSGANLFNPKFPDIECESMIVRNNVIVDCDDSAIEVRGCRNGWVYNNTVIGCGTTFALVAVRPGCTNSGGESFSSNISIFNNLFWNDGNMDRPFLVHDKCKVGLRTGSNLWFNGKAGVPSRGGIDVMKEKDSKVNVEPTLSSTDMGIRSYKDALRFSVSADSSTRHLGMPAWFVTEDFQGAKRDKQPAIGAFE